MKFSIITPVYNSYDKMGPYFDCLENQSFKNFEIILIDDCSTDGSYEKLLNYQKKSKLEITVQKSQENSGPGFARNKGIDLANGEYVIFIDSDDFVDINCLTVLNNTILDTNADCVLFDFFKHKKEKNTYAPTLPGYDEGFISKKNALANVTSSMCGKTYKTEIIKKNNIKFPDLIRFEDMVFNKRVLSKCDNIFYFKKPLYYYVFNEKSIVNSGKNNSIKYAVTAFEVLEKELRDFPNAIDTMFARELLYSTVLTLISNKTKRKEIINYIKNWEVKYPNWYKNREIRRFSLHQKVVLILIKHKCVLGLRVVNYLKKLIK